MLLNKNTMFHISLYVSNIQDTINFYSTILGQIPTKIKMDYAKYELESPGLVLSFVENPDKVSPQFGHLGFRLNSSAEVINKLNEMKGKGVEVIEEMGVNCCYAEQDKFWVKDPDGHMWEFYSFTQDSEFNDPRYSTNEASACCMPKDEEKVKVNMSELNKCVPGSGCC